MHAEARGEPYVGQVAVAAVILNRVKDPNFPNTISGVIYQPWAFTAVHDGQINLEPNQGVVYQLVDGNVVPRIFTRGVMNASHVEVVDGLKEGDQFITEYVQKGRQK